MTEPARDVDVQPAICAAIRVAREEAGVSQEGLAKLLEVRQSSVAKWEDAREPRLDRIASIEEALGMPRGQLLRMAGYVGPWEPR